MDEDNLVQMTTTNYIGAILNQILLQTSEDTVTEDVIRELITRVIPNMTVDVINDTMSFGYFVRVRDRVSDLNLSCMINDPDPRSLVHVVERIQAQLNRQRAESFATQILEAESMREMTQNGLISNEEYARYLIASPWVADRLRDVVGPIVPSYTVSGTSEPSYTLSPDYLGDDVWVGTIGQTIEVDTDGYAPLSEEEDKEMSDRILKQMSMTQEEKLEEERNQWTIDWIASVL